MIREQENSIYPALESSKSVIEGTEGRPVA